MLTLEVKEMDKDIEDKLLNLRKLLLGLNAYGSLGLDDYRLIEDYMSGAFPNLKIIFDNE